MTAQAAPQQVFIYTLADPRTGEVRYVGKTNNLRARFYGHVAEDHTGDHRANWVLGLKRAGLAPVMELLEAVPAAEWQETERFWIESLRFLGCRLVNETSGGDAGSLHSSATRQRMRQSALARMANPEERAKIARGHLGVRPNAATRAKLSFIASHRSPATLAKMSAAHKGRQWSPEQRTKVSAYRKAHVTPKVLAAMAKGQAAHTPQSYDKMVAARRASGVAWHSPQTLAKLRRAALCRDEKAAAKAEHALPIIMLQ